MFSFSLLQLATDRSSVDKVNLAQVELDVFQLEYSGLSRSAPSPEEKLHPWGIERVLFLKGLDDDISLFRFKLSPE